MRKLMIVINGRGGCGKDTLCEIAAKHYKTVNASAIAPIKEIARAGGYRGEKTEAARRFLAELKRAFINYNDLPTAYLLGEAKKFEQGDCALMFAHIREPEEIEKFKSAAAFPCVTLLVRRESAACAAGNDADDNVENYRYDYIFENSGGLEELETSFPSFLQKIVEDKAL